MNIKWCFHIFLLLILAGESFGQTPVWTQMAGAPSGTTRHDDIVFVGETTGWSARGRGGIFKTTDAGNTWVQKFNKPDTHFRCIGFVSELRGFAGNLGVGSYDGNVTDTNVLYQTTDGGETWSVVPGLSESGMTGFCALYVLDSQHIYGGGRVRGPAHFVKSEDGGTNWTVVDLKGAGVMGGIMDVYFKDATNGFVVGMDTNDYFTSCGGNYHGRIAKTTDGGTTWTPVADTGLACTYFWKMTWPTPDIGYTSLQQNGASSSLIYYKTIDGGNTWVSNGVSYASIGIPSFSLLQGIGFITPNEGWVGGPSSVSPPENNFLHTTDGGATWTREGFGDSRSINRIRFYPKFGIASGGKLHIFKVPLAITTPPRSQTNTAGSTATLNVISQGTEPLTFQWRFNGTNIASAGTNSYSVTNFQSANAGSYDVVVRDFSASVTSTVAILSIAGAPTPPVITMQPQNQFVQPGANATFSVSASGSMPLGFQWLFNGTVLSGATQTNYVVTNVQNSAAGNYSVIVSNSAGSVTSAVARLAFSLFADNFENYASPSVITNVTSTNGYKIVFRSSSAIVDFKAVFGFDYSTVTYPTGIPPAPFSGGTTKGLFLTVNKDATAAAAAVNLYPIGQSFGGDFALKFDLWINWANIATSTEHVLFGINHSGNITNRIGQSPSDGLFFAVEGEDDSTATSTTLRDYSVFRGTNNAAPVLMTTNNTTFGPTPPLGPRFDNSDPGFAALFPSQTFPGYGATPAGSAGLRWISVEVRQVNNLITWLMNGSAIAQYTNTYGYTDGTILLGYNDHYSSIGDSNNFVVIDNVRVESITLSPATLSSPSVSGNTFRFTFDADAYETYRVQQTTLLPGGAWATITNLVGTGGPRTVTLPLTNNATQLYFRVVRP